MYNLYRRTKIFVLEYVQKQQLAGGQEYLGQQSDRRNNIYIKTHLLWDAALNSYFSIASKTDYISIYIYNQFSVHFKVSYPFLDGDLYVFLAGLD